MPPVKIFLCEHDAEKRNYLNTLLGGYGHCLVVGASGGGQAAIGQAVATEPDLVIIDLALPDMPGVEAVRQITAALPTAQVLVYTAEEDEEQLFAVLAAGASGYLLKDTAPHRLVEAVEEVMAGGAPLSPRIARKVVGFFCHHSAKLARALSERELEVLRYLAEGQPIRAIAEHVFLTEDGVKKNLHKIYHKLKVANGKEAVIKAIKERIV